MTKREKYTAEFRAQVVKKVEEHNGNISLTSRELGLPMQTLFNWCNKANKGQLIGTEQLICAELIRQLNMGDFP
ncbi:transposase (plasmid) [Wohlfahrtiimonas chitiniclastica]|uniref:transposase n=1 Tax=Wohlfahrtiimonas chitiniclastica TaxID=400946 RepID=UPI0007BE6148|nr:transposase [Wohlfahrtiimonas chitiniclastica]KZS22160.1 transposase [Wohlfahrtiimonas chitiniclastica]WHR56404.1 transposase [Wohlfahrtiimonas chitiniclastica]